MAASTTATRSSKRKRTQVSYCADDYFDSLLEDDQPSAKSTSKVALITTAVVKDNEADNEDLIDVNDDSDDGYVEHKRKVKAPPKKKVRTAKTPKKPKAKKPFPFLDLPAELRDEVYDLCLTDPAGIALVSKRKTIRKTVKRGVIATETSAAYRGKHRRTGGFGWGYGWRRRQAEPRGETEYFGRQSRQLRPNLLAVNKQIREEASTVLYKQEIILEDTTALFNFISTIGDYNRQLVSDLTIRSWGQGGGKGDAHNLAAFAMLSVCKNVRNLFLDCTFYRYAGPAQLADIVYSNAYLFLETVSGSTGDIDAALDVVQLSEWNFNKTRVQPVPSAQLGVAATAQSDEVEYKEVSEVEAEFREELRKLLTSACRRR